MDILIQSTYHGGMATHLGPDTISRNELAALVELDHMTLYRWEKNGVFAPTTPATGSGTRCRYNRTQIDEARVLARLVKGVREWFPSAGYNGFAIELLEKYRADPTAERIELDFGEGLGIVVSTRLEPLTAAA